MRPFSTIANNPHLCLAAMLCIAVFTGGSHAEGCATGRGLTSNNILRLSGSGDTLWMDTWKDGRPALNMIAGKSALADPIKENNWWSFTLGCKKWINGFAFGKGIAVASLDSAPNMIWTYRHATSRIKEYTLAWPEDEKPDRQFSAIKAVEAGGDFYFACLDGGLVRFRPDGDRTVFLPGYSAHVNLSDTSLVGRVDSTRHVIDVEVLDGDSVLIVASPKRIWLFSLADSSWDSGSVSETIADGKYLFSNFESIFVNRFDTSHPIYGTIKVRKGKEDESIFCKYSRTAGTWLRMVDQAPKALSFGPDGYCYMLFDEGSLSNIIRLYRDTLGDSDTTQPLRPVIPDNIIHTRMTRIYDIDIPEIINDILFVPRSDSSGYLWIATSEGLFFSRNETPARSGTDTTSFILIKRAPAIADGLKKTYARPGIITPAVTSCKFIYNISKMGNVTIKIYDYNMDLVTTVIENQRRIPGKSGGPLGRSTVESEDSWDGTNARGRPVAPGVYYYKITTDSGERAFGKIVVAR